MENPYGNYRRRRFQPFDTNFEQFVQEPKEGGGFNVGEAIGGISGLAGGMNAKNSEVAGPPASMISQSGGSKDPYSNMGERFRPSDARLKAYEEYAASAPKREDYQAGTGRKLLASALAGLVAGRGDVKGGMAVGEGIVDQKYNKARRDYEEQGKDLLNLAKLEDDLNERGIRNQNYTDLYKDRLGDDARDEKYKQLGHEIAVEREKRLALQGERRFDLGRERLDTYKRGTDSAISARERNLALAKQRFERGNQPKAVDPSLQTGRDIVNQKNALALADANLSSMPQFAEMYENGKLTKPNNELLAMRQHLVQEFLKRKASPVSGMGPNDFEF